MRRESSTVGAVKADITFMRNGAVLTVHHPEQGADEGYTEQRVYRNISDLKTEIADLWGRYSPEGAITDPYALTRSAE